ncbi:hypothetical protein Elgi_37810 [Paenibacillus elgii]|uniref:hypothetical protein n=1 Tax=Paenibacillus elgii TaxID=189691 RepID=UPI002D7B64B1|nr:hypothetical protein Elgi_37810 [Paenibacillus elgii]
MNFLKMHQLGFSDKQEEYFAKMAQGTTMRNDIALDELIDISKRRGIDFVMGHSVNEGHKVIELDSLLTYCELHFPRK